MDFVKKNLITIISGVVAIAALALIFMGMGKVGDVKDEMTATRQELDQISTLSQGVSVDDTKGGSLKLIPTKKIVEKMQIVSTAGKADGYKLLEVNLKENIGFDPQTGKIKRTPLLDGVFPKAINDAQPYRFRANYQQALDNILMMMKAGAAPSAADLEDSEESLAQEMGFLMDEILASDSKGTTERSSRGSGRRGSRSRDKSSEESLKELAVELAVNKRASEIQVYCGLEDLAVVESCLADTGLAPQVDSMWWAQFSVWLQQDIAAAIADVNADAKDVSESVVKRIMDIEIVHGYLLQDGFVGMDNNTMPESFTGMNSTDYYDTIQFGLTLVVDARRVPEFVDAMYRQNNYVLYSWKIEEIEGTETGSKKGYGQVDPELLYRYGPMPVVKITTYWEGYLLRDFYHWGIVGYDSNKETGKPVLVMYDGKRVEVDNIDDRENLPGFMPADIRKAITGEEDESAGKGGFGY